MRMDASLESGGLSLARRGCRAAHQRLWRMPVLPGTVLYTESDVAPHRDRVTGPGKSRAPPASHGATGVVHHDCDSYLPGRSGRLITTDRASARRRHGQQPGPGAVFPATRILRVMCDIQSLI